MNRAEALKRVEDASGLAPSEQPPKLVERVLYFYYRVRQFGIGRIANLLQVDVMWICLLLDEMGLRAMHQPQSVQSQPLWPQPLSTLNAFDLRLAHRIVAFSANSLRDEIASQRCSLSIASYQRFRTRFFCVPPGSPVVFPERFEQLPDGERRIASTLFELVHASHQSLQAIADLLTTGSIPQLERLLAQYEIPERVLTPSFPEPRSFLTTRDALRFHQIVWQLYKANRHLSEIAEELTKGDIRRLEELMAILWIPPVEAWEAYQASLKERGITLTVERQTRAMQLLFLLKCDPRPMGEESVAKMLAYDSPRAMNADIQALGLEGIVRLADESSARISAPNFTVSRKQRRRSSL